ncbi:MAG TPA: VIT1/CCC1 family protein [Bacteroidales bacterium]|nr:VIT1/CCC1 family protein [Bacteroidales bacterium]HOK75563.1 VIT1/CCC1 family protein [Bacteroidales bacterium]HOM40390.1 VIT1/CCC1 family protein [Bacteroidales bacterium]HPP93548.1 VIT1/CCC1 family protein [Bacteroidales bacterium]HRR16361.1 VIT1/CCC1 family protein [Bacteroidales bacterium]
MDNKIKSLILKIQRNEITEHIIYLKLADLSGNQKNAEILRRIGNQELAHYRYWKTKTNTEIKPDKFRVFRTVMMAKLLGLSFVLKLMEKREGTGSSTYQKIAEIYPESKRFAEEEAIHEKELLDMLDEEVLQYVGSIVLGLNDALVELTGALAGFTLALGDNKIISLAGLVTGISAALSMAASDYLSSKAEGNAQAKKSALYTGMAYFITVILLILPFLLISSKFISLAITLSTAVLIIFFFNFYIATARNLNFRERFTEMTIISLGVAALSFLVGFFLKNLIGVDI